MVIHIHSDTFYSMITNISDNGQDSKSCFNRGYSCKTLIYALQLLTPNITGHHIFSILINVTYNQTINDTYNIGPTNVSILHITGNEGVYINFPRSESSLQIVHRYTSWAWIDLMFASSSLSFVAYQNPSVTHFGDTSIQNSVRVLNCTLASVMWEVVNVTNFVINSTKFIGHKFCPIVWVEYSGNSQTQCVVTISSNVVCNCAVWPLRHLVSMTSNHDGMKDCVVEITNNTFSNLKDYGDMFAPVRLVILWIKGNLESLTFSDNLFINNRLSCIYMQGNSGNMLVQDNVFYGNLQPTNKFKFYNNVLIYLYYTLSTSHVHSLTKIIFDQNVFSGNIQQQLVNIQVVENNATLLVILNNLHVLNNVGEVELITVANKVANKNFKAIVCIEMSLVMENNTHIMQNRTVEDLEVSGIHLVNVKKVVFRNHTTFQNNIGTPLFVENKHSYTGFCILGNLIFRQNFGLLGGAMALHGVSINTSCKSKVLFKDNNSVYGGALYLENTECHVGLHGTMSQTTFKFFENSAMTAGNSIYFASYPIWNLGNECLRNSNLSNTDVGSFPTNILVHTQDNRNSLTIFPGQSIILNTTITDYFRAPSSVQPALFSSVNQKCTHALICISNLLVLTTSCWPKQNITNLKQLLSTQALLFNHLNKTQITTAHLLLWF